MAPDSTATLPIAEHTRSRYGDLGDQMTLVPRATAARPTQSSSG